MKLYILIASFIGITYAANAQEAQSTSGSRPTGNYILTNNGDVITITDKAAGKTYTYPANDTLHYAMMRKLMLERPIMKDRPAPTERKREEVIR